MVPGEKLCPQCRHKLASSEEPAEENTDISDIEDVFGEDFLVESTRSLLNTTLCNLEVSPLKVHSVKSSSKPAVGKRKLKQVEEPVSKKLGTVLNVPESDFETSDNFELTNDIQAKADDLDYLEDCVKEKVEV